MRHTFWMGIALAGFASWTPLSASAEESSEPIDAASSSGVVRGAPSNSPTPPPATSDSETTDLGPGAPTTTPSEAPSHAAESTNNQQAATGATPIASDPQPAPQKLSDEELLTLDNGELPTDLTDDAPALQLYGFADFTYSGLLIGDNNRWAQIYHPYASFAVGNLNVYLASELGRDWRALSEVRFTYLPHGSERIVNGVTERADGTANNYADFERPVQVGGVILERAWLEYTLTTNFTLRAGQWLTPYGIWNVDHGSPTLIATHRPFTIGEELFPERQTGLELHGKYNLGETDLGYHLTLSNGRGPVDSYHDFDRNKAIGARVFLETRVLPGLLTAGGSFYKGTYTDRAELNSVDSSSGEPILSISRPIVEKYHELSLAADAKWEWKGLQTQSEVILNQAAYDVRGARQGLNGSYFTADYQRWGVYGLVAYQLPWVPVMPYTIVEYYNFANRPEVPPGGGVYLGLNVRPIPRVTLKGQYTYGTFDGLGSLGLGRDSISIFELQAAWSF
ncbi:MAG: hypothetical protein SFV15_07355 [Polyangiaceae bacterium]|nr:hypothetical protein [Polyangiaceae bacterium]